MTKMKREKRDAKGWHLPAVEEMQKRMLDISDASVIGSQGFVGALPRIRPSFSFEKYEAEDGRLNPHDCHHTQFLDVSFPPQHEWCLDCGAMITAGTWELTDPIRLLTDAELQEKRDYFHEVWGLK